MKNKLFLSYLLLSVCLTIFAQSPSRTVTEIKNNWKMHRFGNNMWYNATVPGCVHTDLIANKLIPDPFYKDNEKKLQWIAQYSWEYATEFTVDNATFSKQNVELDFKGLDTFSDVYVNDQLVMSTDNMFADWHMDIKKFINEGSNKLRIIFHSPVAMGLLARDKWNIEAPLGFNLDFGPNIPVIGGPADFPNVVPYIRKAAYMFGWDWAPTLTTSGIWRPVYLEAWNSARLNNIQIVQKEIAQKNARVTAMVEVEADIPGSAELSLSYVSGNQKKNLKPVAVQLVKGVNMFPVDITIENPQIWWPNGLGAHPVYEFSAVLMSGSKNLDAVSTRTGLRNIRLITEPDKYGKSFYFEINGIPVFAKGANYVPSDVFPSRVTKEHYDRLVGSAVDANMNMLRVWGGGIYESDYFYDLCDANGIMIWQDFAFAIYMGPNSEEYLNNVRHELNDNIKRLRNHPSIVLWCGNNETEMLWDIIYKGLFGLGQGSFEVPGLSNSLKMMPKSSVKKETTEMVMKAYDDLYYNLMPEMLKKLDLNNRPYRSSSPVGDWKVPATFNMGDMHFYVAVSNVPFESYYTMKSRFFSEHGWQSYPDFNTVKKFSTMEDWNYLSPIMKHHQRASNGNQVLDRYMKMYYRYPKDFESYLYVSQLMQADVMKMAFETHRKWRPFTMGTLYWQLNDVWPAASWASMDYMNHWKALLYQVKRSFADVILTPTWFRDTLSIHLVSDVPKPVKGVLEVKITDLNGKQLKKFTQAVKMEGNNSSLLVTKTGKEILAEIDTTNSVCITTLRNGSQVLAENRCFFTANKNLQLSKNTLSTKVTPIGDSFTIEVSSTSFARGVFLSTEEEGFFSDNYFDLFPGQKKIVTFKPEQKTVGFEKKLKIMSLADTY